MSAPSLHPRYIEEDGKKTFVVLPYDEFVGLQEHLEDAEDLRIIRREREISRSEPTLSLDEVRRRLGL